MRSLRHIVFLLASAMAAPVPFLIASCSNGAEDAPQPVDTAPNADAGSPGTQGQSCATPATGCECGTPGDKVACGNVHATSGTYISCSPGFRTCNAVHQWGDCLGDRVGDPRSETHGFGFDNLQLDASGCDANACDPSCQNFVDTANGVDASPDAGLVWNEAGVSLSPVVPDSGPPCSAFTIAPLNNQIVVTSIPKTTDPASTAVTATYSGGQQYVATVSPAGCYVGTVPALWGMDRYDIGTFGATSGIFQMVVAQATATTTPIDIAAYVGAFTPQYTTASVTVNATDTSAANNLPDGGSAVTPFSGAVNGGNEPSGVAILYPYNNTMFPLGLIPPVIQWNNTSNNASTSATLYAADAVKITLRYPDTSPIFTWSAITNVESPVATTLPALASSSALAAAPRFQPDANVWNAFAQSAKGGASGAIAVQRYRAGKLYNEMKVTVRFATGQLKGTVYYQSYETQLVKNSNYNLPSTGTQTGAATLAIKPGASAPTVAAGDIGDTGGGGCRVCHTVSGDGSRLITQQGSNYAQSYTYNLTNGTGDTAYGGNNGKLAWIAMNSNGHYGFGNAASSRGSLPGTSTSNNSALYDMTSASGTQVTVSGLPTIKASMPSFSPDDKHIAFNFDTGTGADNTSLETIDFNIGTLTFSNLQKIYTPSSGYVAWPVYMPASDRVVFTDQTAGGYGETWQSAAANLWWVDTATKNAHVLQNASGASLPAGVNHSSAGDAVLNFEPTINPQIIGSYAWMVFTSRRMFGNVATVDAFCSDGRSCTSEVTIPTPKKLWMAAVDPSVATTSDGSFSAFYLPGQELLAGNSRGFWVLNACEGAGMAPANVCDSDLDCCQSPAAERCVAVNSTPPIKKYCTLVPSSLNCVADNASCAVITNCCGALTGSTCIGGVCKPPPPLVNYSAASFTRDYIGICPTGYSPTWRFFSWQASTPLGTPIATASASIQFTAQSADSVAAITSVSSPTPVVVGLAQPDVNWSTDGWPSEDQTPTWTSATSTVDTVLRNAGQTSRNVLRVTARLSPASNPAQTPVLEDWRATYDCTPSQ